MGDLRSDFDAKIAMECEDKDLLEVKLKDLKDKLQVLKDCEGQVKRTVGMVKFYLKDVAQKKIVD